MKGMTFVAVTGSLMLASGVALANPANALDTTANAAANATNAQQSALGTSQNALTSQAAASAKTQADNALTTAKSTLDTTAPADAAAQTNAASDTTNIGDNNVMNAQKNLQAGEAFLASNKTKPGIVTLPDGLQYKVIDVGNGTKPTATDVVTVNYEGKLINGKVFDSSYQRGKAVSFPVNGVIQGWQQALQMMKAGATWELYIPAKLAYGEHGAPGVIGPNETLIFKVHLISVKKQNA